MTIGMDNGMQQVYAAEARCHCEFKPDEGQRGSDEAAQREGPRACMYSQLVFY